eukprot:7265895-Prymnesium_polylepis.2
MARVRDARTTRAGFQAEAMQAPARPAGPSCKGQDALDTPVVRNEGVVGDFAAGVALPPGAAWPRGPRPHRDESGVGGERSATEHGQTKGVGGCVEGGANRRHKPKRTNEMYVCGSGVRSSSAAVALVWPCNAESCALSKTPDTQAEWSSLQTAPREYFAEKGALCVFSRIRRPASGRRTG